ncbi:MAG TPA: hypothetical protein VFH61_05710 [Thermoleophilia bacterium]|nr:hypothetical protein [Thermoleophilia bacterium]
MSDVEQLLWRAIEGALGSEKRAYLQRAPLTSIIGAGPGFALPHAIGAVSASGHSKHAEAESIRSGLQALALVAKEAQVTSEEGFISKVARAHKLRILEPALTGGQKQAAVQERRRIGTEVMHLVKEAGVGGVLDDIVKNPTLRETGKKMLGGAAVAGGAALPTYAVGSHLSDKFTEDARDRALQTAGGVAGIAALGYGAKKMMDAGDDDQSRGQNYRGYQKHSSAHIPAEVYGSLLIEPEKIAYLATCVYLDGCLASKEQTQKVAALRDLNNEFLVELMATSVKVAENGPTQSSRWDAWRVANKAPAPRAAKTDPARAKSYTQLQGQSAAGHVPSAGWTPESSVTSRAQQMASKVKADAGRTTKTVVGKSSGRGPGGATK